MQNIQNAPSIYDFDHELHCSLPITFYNMNMQLCKLNII